MYEALNIFLMKEDIPSFNTVKAIVASAYLLLPLLSIVYAEWAVKQQ